MPTALIMPNVFDLRVFFQAGTQVWTNTYECKDLSLTNTPPAPTNDIVNRLTTFVENNVAQAATVTEIKCYPHRYGPGRLPLVSEGAIWILPVNAPGNRETAYNYVSSATQYEDYRMAGYVQKLNAGRVGKLFLHNLFMEGDLSTTAPGQPWAFTGGADTVNPTSFQTQVTAYLQSHLASGSSTDFHYCVAHVRDNHDGTFTTGVSEVSNFVLHAATWRRP